MELALDATELVSRPISDVMLERSAPVAVESFEVRLPSSELACEYTDEICELAWDSMEEKLEDAEDTAEDTTDEMRLLVWVGNPGCPNVVVVVGLPNVCVGVVKVCVGCVNPGCVWVGKGWPGCSVVVEGMPGVPPPPTVCVTVTVQWPS